MMDCKVYRFPSNGRADDLELGEQLEYVCDEAIEAMEAQGDGPERVIEELWDTIQAAEGALRKFGDQRVRDGYYKVVAKCHERGDYDIADLVRSDWGLS